MAFADAEWNLGETLLWACRREPELFGAIEPRLLVAYLEGSAIGRRLRNYGTAERELRAALTEGRVTGSGVYDGVRQPLRRHGWTILEFDLAQSSVRDIASGESWISVLLLAKQVQELWPVDEILAAAPGQRGRKAGQEPRGEVWCEIVDQLLAAGAKPITRELALRILNSPWGTGYGLDAIEGAIRGTVNDWKRKNGLPVRKSARRGRT